MIQTRSFALRGGLDLVTPPIELAPNYAIAGVNYEPHPRGYQRVAGYERFDGRPKPSEATYWVLPFSDGVAPINEDDIVVGATSGATGRAVVDALVDSGDYGSADAAGRLVLMAVSGEFEEGENLEVSNAPVAKAAGAAEIHGALTDEDDRQWSIAAIEKTRAAIEKVPGSGPVRGVWVYKGVKYAFRDNEAGTECVMHKATTTGWQPISLGYELAFSGGGVRVLEFTSGGTYEIQPGDEIEGATSGATATVRQVIVESGTWAGGDAAGKLVIVDQAAMSFAAENLKVGANDDVATISGDSVILGIEEGDTVEGITSGATALVKRVVLESGDWSTHDARGRLILASVTGNFQAENIGIGDSIGIAAIEGDASAITLPPGGRYEFRNHNFYGAADLERMYGVNGISRGFEFDGEVFVPISTGMLEDKPIWLEVHRNHLFYAFRGGSLQHSSIGNPYQWQVLTGAGEIGIGEEITGLLGSVAGVLAIFGRKKIAVLFGTDAENWELRTLSAKSGAAPWTAQMVGSPIYRDASGLRSLETSERFGDFDIGSITKRVEPLFELKERDGVTEVGSIVVRSKDQYRLYWSDGTGITVYFGRNEPEMFPFDLGFAPTCLCAEKDDATGKDVLLAGTADGWVYELDAGSSFDGQPVEAFLRLAFNHAGTPDRNKRWSKVTLEMDAAPDVQLAVTAEYDYADADQPPSARNFRVRGGGGFWDELRWNEFYWSSPVVGRAEASIDGFGRNISVTIVSEATYEEPHVLHGLTLNFSYRGLTR